MIRIRTLLSTAGAVGLLTVLAACTNGGPPTAQGTTIGNNSIGTQNRGATTTTQSTATSTANGATTAAGGATSTGDGSTSGSSGVLGGVLGGLTNTGGGGSGSSGTSVSAGGTLDIPSSAAGSSLTVQCNGGGTVNLAEAGQVTLTILGHCNVVDVNSGQDTVTVGTADAINVNGSENTVDYHCGNPQVTKGGSGNTVEQTAGSC
jgi:hypothetical protein